MIAALFSLIVATLVGGSVLILLRARLTVAEFLALAPGLGAGLITMAIFGMMAMGRPFSTGSVAALGLLLASPLAVLAVWRMRREARSSVFEPPPANDLSLLAVRLLVAAIAAVVCYSFFVAHYWPPYDWDALAIWVIKGRALHDKGVLTAAAEGSGLFYPLNLPLQIAWLIDWMPVSSVQVLFPLYFALLLLAMAGSLRRHLGARWTLTFVLLLATTPAVLAQSSNAMSDVPFAYYYAASVLVLLRFFERPQLNLAVLSTLLSGLASWTRADGLMYFAINATVLLAWIVWNRKGWAALPAYVAVFVACWWPWTRYVAIQGWGGHFVPAAMASINEILAGEWRVKELTTVGNYFRAQWTSVGVWGCTWMLFAAALLNVRAVRRHWPLVLVVALNVAGLLFTYYSFPEREMLVWAMDAGFVRMMTHFVPVMWLFTALALAPIPSPPAGRSTSLSKRDVRSAKCPAF